MNNIEKVSPGVEIQLGGKTRKLIFNMWAFYLLEKATGKNALAGEVFMNPTATDLLTLVWAALQHEEKVTIEEVGGMFSLQDIPEISRAIQKAFAQASPPSEDEQKKEKPESANEAREKAE